MKRLLAVLCVFMLSYMSAIGYAGPKEDYEKAYQVYISAGASVAAYNGRIGELARGYLRQEGWTLDYYMQSPGHTGARFLLAQKATGVNSADYILAYVGTETNEDIKTDLQVDKVYFAGTNAAEFAVNAAKKDMPDTEPKVHQGFNGFVQASPSASIENAHHDPFFLPSMLLANKNSRLYITGHSLGGAAATLMGARLISMGISPEQIEVITFGAPAVGNAAFAAKFEPVLDLTRVVNSGDPVTGALQAMAIGYKQFGREIRWNPPDTVGDSHQLTGYVDSAIKNYFDKRSQAVLAGMNLSVPAVVQQANHGRVYIVPLQNNLPASLATEFWYMQEALKDEYQQTLPDYVTGASVVPNAWRQAASASRCQWAIISEVSALRLKQEKNTYYIVVTQTVYDVATGAVADTDTFSTGTYTLTPLEAFIHSFKGMSIQLNDRLAKTMRSAALLPDSFSHVTDHNVIHRVPL
jgi:hypothetical protein